MEIIEFPVEKDKDHLCQRKSITRFLLPSGGKLVVPFLVIQDVEILLREGEGGEKQKTLFIHYPFISFRLSWILCTGSFTSFLFLMKKKVIFVDAMED